MLNSCVSLVTFRVSEPWDLLRGFDVFRDGVLLCETLSEAVLQHWAPNCATFSRAREIPLKGIRNPPRPIRSEIHPEGIPDEVRKMSNKQKKRLEQDTAMADLSAERCMEAHTTGRLFSLEHPARSLARHLPSWKRLEGTSGVNVIEYTTCMFEGSRRKKRQVLITNSRELGVELNLVCRGSSRCERTGQSHQKWKPITAGSKVIQFTTGEEREYPVGFCRSYAKAAKEAMGKSGQFVEIFSGPNAPLSREIAKVFGEPLRGDRISSTKKGVKNELSNISDLISEEIRELNFNLHPKSLAEQRSFVCPPTELLPNRLAAVKSGKQPSFGKRSQIIPDGIQDPLEHLSLAVGLSHPFDGLEALKDDHMRALELARRPPLESNKERLRKLAQLRILAKDPKISLRQKEFENGASKNAMQLKLKPRAALLEELGKILNVEDKGVPLLCMKGMTIVGPALISPFFTEFLIPSSISIKELVSTAASRREQTVRRIEKMGKESESGLAESIYAKTLKEVRAGTMSGPFSPNELDQMFGKCWNLVPSFGLHQGHDEKGDPKYRRIDDHSASLNNQAATRLQKIPMSMADYVMSMVKGLSENTTEPIHLCTEDMKGAYRQVPLADSNTQLAVTGVYSPREKRAHFFLMHGQPFGAGHSVPNFYRVAEFLNRIIVRHYGVLMDHFFDDFYMISKSSESTTSAFCIRETFAQLGFVLDPDKSQVPSEVAHVLGVLFNTQSIRSQSILSVEPKPTRRQNITHIINGILKSNHLSPTTAASLIGKFGFLCTTLYGKIGRCCTNAIRARQYSSSSDTSLNPSIIVSLRLMRLFTDVAKARQLSLKTSSPPFILYTDASDVPERSEARWVVGAVLIDPHDTNPSHTFWKVPEEMISKWLPKQSYMGQLELLAAPVALATWSNKLQGKRLIHFVDNDSASACLVKGYSPLVDSCALVGEYWLLACNFSIDPYIERVESKSNLSDGASRLDFDLLTKLKSKFCSPDTSILDSHLDDTHWFFISNKQREENAQPAKGNGTPSLEKVSEENPAS